MMMINLLVVLGVVIRVSTQSRAADHNEDAYRALCGVLGSAVKKWEEVKNRSKEDPLYNALEKTIFGENGGPDLVGLREGLPKDYQVVEGSGSSRGFMCGPPLTAEHVPHQARWPGHSAPHDLICLCTPGEHGWPLNGTAPVTVKLCGQDAQTFVDSEGWADNGYEGGLAQMTTTWLNVAVPCLKGDGAAEDLKSTLQKFKDNLGGPVTGHPASHTLGEGNFRDNGACDGQPDGSICVFYCNNTHRLPWWTELEQALETDKQKMYTENTHTPSTSRFTSSPPNETNNPDSNVSNIHRFEYLRSKAPKNIPCSWLLGASFFI